MRLVYCGPHAEGQTIAATGQHCPPDVPVEVPDDVAERLLEQEGIWRREDETEPPDDPPARTRRPRAEED